MLGPDDLVFCSGTLLRATFRELLEACEAGGYRGLSLWPHHVEGARAAGLTDADLRRACADHGVVPVELEPCLSWLPRGSLPAEARGLVGPSPEAFFALAEALESPSILAVDGFGARAERAEIVDAFAVLCESAAAFGIQVKLEFTPWSAIPDASVAAEIVKSAGSANAGILVDAWHHFRGAHDLSQLEALSGAMVQGVQLNDAPAEPTGESLAQESMHARRLPGEGALDGVGLIRALDRIGCRAPLGVEVFSDPLAALPPAEVGRRTGEAARAWRSAARGHGS